MSEVVAPILFQVGIGGIGGFFMGYAIKKVIKIALLLGILVFAIILLAYQNVINLNFGGLIDAISNFAKAINPTLGLLAPLLSSLPFIGSLVIGLIVGFKMG